MLFVEPRFFVFFAIVFALYWALRSNEHRKFMLTIASYIFYGAWDWRFLGLIAFTTLLDYTLARAIEAQPEAKARKRLLIISLISNLGFLGFFKYFNFFAEGFTDLVGMFGIIPSWTTLNIILPVGISFFTFQSLSYTIDVYRGKLKAEKRLRDFAFFVAFFPQLVAGPIVRAADFLPQVHQTRKWADVAVKPLLLLFAVGFIKKACISDNLAFYVDLVFNDPHAYSSPAIMAGTVLYAIQIYCDFSGYTDMAIACAGLLGYRLTLNFNAPYLATSIVDFWHRWHISLSTWLRDYLYIPLGGSRHGELMRYRNLLLTMLLGGLWHGAAWTFIIWGGLHGLALSINHLWNDHAARRLPKILGWALTFWFVCLCWIFFRASSLGDALYIVRSYVTLGADGAGHLPFTLYVVPFLLMAVHSGWRRLTLEERITGLNTYQFSVILALFSILAASFIPSGYTPFIYFQF